MAAGLTQVLAETTNGKTITYLYGLGLVAQSMNGVTEYNLTDGLGSVRQLTNAGGQVLLSQTFDAYGNTYQRARGSVLWDAASPFGWTGEQSDPNGLTYLRARYYAPGMGRFTQLDPFAGALALPASMNGYAYGHGNPVRYTDPSGQFICAGFCLAALIVVGLTLTGAIAGGGIEIGNQMIFEGRSWNWGMVGFRAGEGAILGALTGLFVAGAYLVVGASLTIGASGISMSYGVGITAAQATAFIGATEFASGVAIGSAWDVNVWGDSPGRAVAVNLTGEVLGELGGRAIGRLFKRAGHLEGMERLARAGITDEGIDALLPDEALVREMHARARLINETRARATAITTAGPEHLSNRQRGPVLSGAAHPELDQVYYGLNHDTPPPNLRPILQARLAWLEGYLDSKGLRYLPGAYEKPGLHSEIWALNEAIIARERQLGRDITATELGEFMIHNRFLKGTRKVIGIPPRCPHCEFLTLGVNVIGGN